jgi:hypothetical protein
MPCNNGYCSTTPSANFGWGARTTEHGLALGKKLGLARSQPQNKLCLVRAWPRPPAPTNPTEGHSFNCSLDDCEPQSRLAHGLGKTSASTERDFGLDNTDERTPDVIRSRKADVRYPMYCQEFFAILATALTTMTQIAPPSDKLGHATELQALASALCTVKYANTGTGHPLPGSSQ